MSKRGKIPISEGKRLCTEYAAPIVICFTLHDGGESFNVMSYGATKALCRHAASLAEQMAKKIFDGEIAPVQDEPMNLPDVPTQWEAQP